MLRYSGVTQAELAAALGRSQQSVSLYLTGGRSLPVGFRDKLAGLSSSRKAHAVMEAIPR